MSRRVALLFAYDGSRFDGYARQGRSGIRTVEDALMAAAVQVGVADSLDDLGWRTGSRTDRGVSARRNVVSFTSRIPARRVALALVGGVPGVWPLASVAVEDGFDPRRASERVYRYHLARPWSVADEGVLRDAMTAFVGRHDLSAFAKREAGRDPVRTVAGVAVTRAAEGLVVEVRGRAFLWQQVRRMVSAGLAVVAGDLSRRDLERRLEEGGPPLALEPAPAEPLVLWSLRYPDVPTEPSGEVLERLAAEWSVAHSAAWARRSFLGALARPEPDEQA